MSESTVAIERETVGLAEQLIACRSVTPADGGSLDLVATRLRTAGFACERVDRDGVGNLWARHGNGRPLICLAGHVDVVPAGSADQWTTDPFTPAVRDGYLYGRGAADMKTSVAAMVTAAERVVGDNPGHPGSIALLLTSDEEGDAINGTAAVVDRLRSRGETIDACILGEPTSLERFGDTVKNGRRGSLNGTLRVRGVQGHVAYPERARNPIHEGLPALAELAATRWDDGNEYFPPTSFQISNVQAGAGAVNVIPGALEVFFNFRFSTESTVDGLETRVKAILDRHGLEYDLTWSLSGSPFMTPRGRLVEAISRVIAAVTGVTPALSTGGGTSDGRFIAAVAREIVEFGPLAEGMHGVDERMRVADIGPLSRIYEGAISTLLAE